MRRFVIVRTPDSDLPPTAVPMAFPDRHIEVVPERVWFVAGDHKTCNEVCEAVGIGPRGGAERAGVVVRVGAYSGYEDGELWEKLDDWARAKDE